MINDVPGAPTEGLHALASDAKGQLFAAWLDKRGGQGTKLYGARSTDGGATWSKNVMIYRIARRNHLRVLPSLARDRFRRAKCW